jgi:hypothetical protein
MTSQLDSAESRKSQINDFVSISLPSQFADYQIQPNQKEDWQLDLSTPNLVTPNQGASESRSTTYECLSKQGRLANSQASQQGFSPRIGYLLPYRRNPGEMLTGARMDVADGQLSCSSASSSLTNT